MIEGKILKVKITFLKGGKFKKWKISCLKKGILKMAQFKGKEIKKGKISYLKIYKISGISRILTILTIIILENYIIIKKINLNLNHSFCRIPINSPFSEYFPKST